MDRIRYIYTSPKHSYRPRPNPLIIIHIHKPNTHRINIINFQIKRTRLSPTRHTTQAPSDQEYDITHTHNHIKLICITQTKDSIYNVISQTITTI